MKKTIILLMAISVFSKLFGFLRDVVLAYFFGASEISDAYLVSLSIPTLIFSFIGTALSTTYIPVFTKVGEERGTGSAIRYSNTIITITLILSTFTVALIIILLVKPEGLLGKAEKEKV